MENNTETMTVDIKVEMSVTVSVDDWALAYGIDRSDRTALLSDFRGWLQHNATQVPLPSDIDGKVDANVTRMS